ncbi:MAG: bifunctional 2-polyprenyl-6-hydroxyphenol methylase/3-demethylubiquinol 3-O-methyltransferase UbiG, partial [Gammaproteobacteria bacterium]|nr:bifunctional 2-polyprenyl-6-hydroxyphenol methylase/3-demethylubiquinol 3-O-methyltransferase UbiG [Gammaproteobacteria bacterium]
RGATVSGIDAGREALEVAKLHLLESGLQIDYQHTTAEDFAETHENSFDAVTCLEMLEHVPDPASVIAACAKMVKPGGKVFFSTINRNPKAYALAIVGAEYIMKMLTPGTHDYEKFIKPSELSAWIREADMNVLDIRGMSYNPIGKEFRLSKDIDVNYLICAQKD